MYLGFEKADYKNRANFFYFLIQHTNYLLYCHIVFSQLSSYLGSISLYWEKTEHIIYSLCKYYYKYFLPSRLLFSQKHSIIGSKNSPLGERTLPMRTFDYSNLADRTWDNEIVSYLTQIHEYKGKQDLYIRQNLLN